MELYANVIIDISLEKLDRIFQYRIPENMAEKLRPGVQVQIPFGRSNRRITGYVIELTNESLYDPRKMKEIAGIVPESIDAPNQLLQLAAWIRRNYGGTMNQALKTVMPVKRKQREKEEKTIRLLISEDDARAGAEECRAKHHTAKARLLDALADHPQMELTGAKRELNLSVSTLRSLEAAGMICTESGRVYRGMPAVQNEAENLKIPFPGRMLNKTQQKIANDIIENQRQGDHRPCLIFGVTGSGKTEIYLELIAAAASEGKPSIVLVPEIALTWQTVQRFTDRFGRRVAVLHSKMSPGERFDQYERAKNGEVDVMVGPRSALFTPFSRIGYIIIDEEHEASYKSETTPRYHARETAIFRASQYGACVVLGSATPSVESYRRAKAGLFHLYEMKERVERRPMPEIFVEDMRLELKNGNRSILSDRLREQVADRLRRKEQTMLFLNRRGMAGFISCRSCGAVVRCPHCDVSLSLHKDDRLVCHYCGYERPAVRRCPSCGSKLIGGFRAGTQKVESDIKKLFPEAGVLRMDADTTAGKGSYEKILKAMADRKADILIGTQMIVKGHDFPGVTLVGILAADLSLNVPDFRASERTYQLLTQAAGRAGRGERPGEVVIQTYQPEHYSIQAAKKQEYEEFYESEMRFRTLLHYPPAWNMLVIHISCAEEAAAMEIAEALDRQILRKSDASMQKIGPADASIARIRDVYRKVIYIKHADYEKLIALKDNLEQKIRREPIYKKGLVQFDFNPMGGF